MPRLPRLVNASSMAGVGTLGREGRRLVRLAWTLAVLTMLVQALGKATALNKNAVAVMIGNMVYDIAMCPKLG